MRNRIAYTLTPAQYATALQRARYRMGSHMHTHGLLRIASALFAGALAYLVFTGIWMVDIMGWERSEYVAVAAGIALLAWWFAAQSQRQGLKVLLRRGEALACGPRELLIEDEGAWDLGPQTDNFIRWSAWTQLEEYEGLLLCHLDDFSFVAIPITAFASEEERERFKALVRSNQAKAKRGPQPFAPVVSSVVAEPDAPAPAGLGFLARAALRIAFLRRTDGAALRATWPRVIAAGFVAMLVPTLFGALDIADAGQLEWNNLPAAIFILPLAVVAAVVIAQLLDRMRDVATLALGILLAWIAIDFLSLATFAIVSQAAPSPAGVALPAWQYGPISWLTLAVFRFAVASQPTPTPRRGWVLLACGLLLALPLAGVDHERRLWTRDYSRMPETAEQSSRRYAAASEESLYEQPRILERELAAVKAGRKGVIDVFFVGVAGYGHQDVFMREVDSVAALFRERFDAGGHIVKLVNNPKTAMTLPIASATSLRAALKRVAEQMDGDEDVLVLFLTSHGSADHRFSMDLFPLRLKEITPSTLREILDASGIRNRVLVVSACYSGGFVAPLRDANTLVITAASTVRSSFGCSNENDWTYFGKAYFDEALRRTHSFTAAFDAARPVIAQREREQKFDPSDPQMAVGEGIIETLAKLEAQLDSR